MSERIEELRAQLARARRPHRFWATVVVVLSAAFVGEVGLVVAQTIDLRRPTIVVAREPAPQPTRPTQPSQPPPAQAPQAAPPPKGKPELLSGPDQPPAPPPHRFVLDDAPVCAKNDPLC